MDKIEEAYRALKDAIYRVGYQEGYKDATAKEYEAGWMKGYDKGRAEAFQVFQDALREIRILETDCSWKGDTNE